MEIVSVISAKALWYLDLRWLNPRGRSLYPLLAERMRTLYGFTPPTEFDEDKGVVFAGGEFSVDDEVGGLTGVKLTLYNNGIIAETMTSTADSEQFLNRVFLELNEIGVIQWKNEYIRRRQYASVVHARSKEELTIPSIEPALQLLSESATERQFPMFWDGLSISLDSDAPIRRESFKFERLAGTALEERLWFSSAPVQTSRHQDILQLLELCLTSK